MIIQILVVSELPYPIGSISFEHKCYGPSEPTLGAWHTIRPYLSVWEYVKLFSSLNQPHSNTHPHNTTHQIMDRLGMLAMDENRDFGGRIGQGGVTDETIQDELDDIKDMVRRDRNHPSVFIWSLCNEVGCNNESSAKAFRDAVKLVDPTRAVTQNHHGTELSTSALDVQGFSHKHTDDFVTFHKLNPTKPMVASECCSCMSQRNIDFDFCTQPKDGGCENPAIDLPNGTFYNNNIGECTSSQVIESESLDYVSGTYDSKHQNS